jgi:hypothetical protein
VRASAALFRFRSGTGFPITDHRSLITDHGHGWRID